MYTTQKYMTLYSIRLPAQHTSRQIGWYTLVWFLAAHTITYFGFLIVGRFARGGYSKTEAFCTAHRVSILQVESSRATRSTCSSTRIIFTETSGRVLIADTRLCASWITVTFLAEWKVPEPVHTQVTFPVNHVRFTITGSRVKVTVEVIIEDALWITITVHTANGSVIAKRLISAPITLRTRHSLRALTLACYRVTRRRTVTSCQEKNYKALGQIN